MYQKKTYTGDPYLSDDEGDSHGTGNRRVKKGKRIKLFVVVAFA